MRSKNSPKRGMQPLVDSMAESIRAVGKILNPIQVRPVKGGYEILDGEIRWLAALQVGMDIVPIEVLPIDKQTADDFRFITNWEPELEINPETIIYGLERLVEEFGSESGEIVVEKLAFLQEHNTSISSEHQARAEALLRACGIDPVA
jgi:ParB family transcriptional regulator, chromosome partitioning protein